MFNLSGSEIVFILLLALVVLGPEKLPDAIRRFGKTYGEVKKMSSGFQSELRSALDEPMRELRETADLARKAAEFPLDDKPEPEPAARAADAAPTPASTPSPAVPDVIETPTTATPPAPDTSPAGAAAIDAPADEETTGG